MGYDMTWEYVPDEIVTATNAARDQGLAANKRADEKVAKVKERKPDAVSPMPFGLPHPDGKEPDPELVAIERERWEAWEAMDEAERSYFRLNIGGMGLCREIMADHGMLAFEQPEEASFASVPSLPQPEEEHFDDEGEPRTPEAEAWQASHESVLRASSTEPGIPIWKLGSNDNWLVTPEEILAALEKAPESVTALEDNEWVTVPWWPKWLRFLREAANHGGFRVR